MGSAISSRIAFDDLASFFMMPLPFRYIQLEQLRPIVLEVLRLHESIPQVRVNLTVGVPKELSFSLPRKPSAFMPTASTTQYKFSVQYHVLSIQHYLRPLRKTAELYALCPIEVKRQIWRSDRRLFEEELVSFHLLLRPLVLPFFSAPLTL